MMTTPRTTVRLLAAPALLSVLLAGAAVAWTSSSLHPTKTAKAYDYCVVVYPVYVEGKQVFGGGTYCVPVPEPVPTPPAGP